jgi:hypothetical protein
MDTDSFKTQDFQLESISQTHTPSTMASSLDSFWFQVYIFYFLEHFFPMLLIGFHEVAYLYEVLFNQDYQSNTSWIHYFGTYVPCRYDTVVKPVVALRKF